MPSEAKYVPIKINTIPFVKLSSWTSFVNSTWNVKIKPIIPKILPMKTFSRIGFLKKIKPLNIIKIVTVEKSIATKPVVT